MTVTTPAPAEAGSWDQDRSEQTRARYPDEDGFIERHGVRTFYERYGDGDPTVLFLPTWSIVHSRSWKLQIPYFARHFRVLTFDGRGNGRSDRPRHPDAYREEEFAGDALAVMDATLTKRAILVSLSRGAERSLLQEPMQLPVDRLAVRAIDALRQPVGKHARAGGHQIGSYRFIEMALNLRAKSYYSRL